MKYIARIFGEPVLYKYCRNDQRHKYFIDRIEKYREELLHQYERQPAFIKFSGRHYRYEAETKLPHYETQKTTKVNWYFSPKGLVKALAQEKHRQDMRDRKGFYYLSPALYSNSCKEVEKMAWRPTRFLIEGELDNTKPGKVTGWMRFAGIKGKIRFDLVGDFHRDIRGARIRFKGDTTGQEAEAKSSMKGFARWQVGKVGDMTAGFEPADYVKGFCYLEWYSEENGRVVLELEQDKVQVIGTPILADKCEPVSRQEQHKNLVEFLEELANSFQMRS